MTSSKLVDAASASVSNGNRLTEDAETLLEYGRFPSACAFAILAQEEFAKALLLRLVSEGAIAWSADVYQALRDHICKQLATAVLDFAYPDDEEFLRRYAPQRTDEDPWQLPDNVIDAVHVLIHERMRRGVRSDWLDPGQVVEPDIKKLATGSHDKLKQNALYVGIGTDGSICSTPVTTTTERLARYEFERAKRIGRGLSAPNSASIEMVRVTLLFKVLTQAISVEQFRSQWL